MKRVPGSIPRIILEGFCKEAVLLMTVQTKISNLYPVQRNGFIDRYK
jgi:hypothetical protein